MTSTYLTDYELVSISVFASTSLTIVACHMESNADEPKLFAAWARFPLVSAVKIRRQERGIGYARDFKPLTFLRRKKVVNSGWKLSSKSVLFPIHSAEFFQTLLGRRPA